MAASSELYSKLNKARKFVQQYNPAPAVASAITDAADIYSAEGGNPALANQLRKDATDVFNAYINKTGYEDRAAILSRISRAMNTGSTPTPMPTTTNVTTAPIAASGGWLGSLIGGAIDVGSAVGIPGFGTINTAYDAAAAALGGGSSKPQVQDNPLNLTPAEIAQMSQALQNAYGLAQPQTYGPATANVPTFLDPNGTAGNLPTAIAIKPQQTARLKAPRGYVIVTIPNGDPFYTWALNQGGVVSANGVKIAMAKPMARKFGMWKPRPKPLLTSTDMRTIKRAETLQRKVALAAKRAGVSCRVPRKR